MDEIITNFFPLKKQTSQKNTTQQKTPKPKDKTFLTTVNTGAAGFLPSILGACWTVGRKVLGVPRHAGPRVLSPRPTLHFPCPASTSPHSQAFVEGHSLVLPLPIPVTPPTSSLRPRGIRLRGHKAKLRRSPQVPSATHSRDQPPPHPT